MLSNIEAERVRQQITQDKLAGILGVTRKTYYSWIMSGSIPSTKLIKMSKLFNCSVDYLLGLREERMM